MFSEVAVMEIAIRSVKDNGYISLVMPENVFMNKFQDKDIFMKYFMANLDPIAKIDLPKKTHAGTEYPVSLYIFKKAGCLVGNAGCAGCAAGQVGQNGPGEVTISSGNRNFPGKQGDGKNYLVSPEVVAYSVLNGYISFETEEN